jgi:hypothetical protein
LSIPVRRVFDLFPRSYHDSIPGRIALKPFFRRGRSLHCLHVIVESDPEVGVVPTDDRVFHFGQQKGQIVPELLEAERLVIHGRIDAEAAGVGAAQTPDHRHNLDRRGLPKRGLDELPPLLQRRQVDRLRGGRQIPANRPVRRTILQHVGHHAAIGEAEHVIEVLARILGVTARVGPPQNGDRASTAEEVAQRIGQLSRLGEGADEKHIQITRQVLEKILEPGIAHQPHVVTLLLTPHADHLGHDARQVGIHQTAV